MQTTVDVILLIVGIGLVLLGYILGFGKTLKIATGGIVGVIISIFICIAFGGMVLGTKLVGGWIGDLNAFLASKWSFLGKIQLSVIIFYILFFVFVQVVRWLTVKFICGIFEADTKVMKIVNRGLGMLLLPAFAFTMLLLILAIVKLFDKGSVMDPVAGGVLAKLYEINPIALHV